MRPARRNVVEARIRVKYDSVTARSFAKHVMILLDLGLSVQELKRMVNTCAELMDN